MLHLLYFFHRLAAARIVDIYGAATLEAFALFDPFARFGIPASPHVGASYLVAGNAVNA
jgi:hypothetical protein